MIPNNSFKTGRNSSSVYKPANMANMGFFQRLWFYARSLALWAWNAARKSGWVLSSAFIILILPSLMLQMLDYDPGLMSEFDV